MRIPDNIEITFGLPDQKNSNKYVFEINELNAKVCDKLDVTGLTKINKGKYVLFEHIYYKENYQVKEGYKNSKIKINKHTTIGQLIRSLVGHKEECLNGKYIMIDLSTSYDF